ncbi:uncharacterized protein OCT59_009170 [Rhizophagus irregularis]|uniref:uncharacterized protein n=1 Tax=Rhizophagus irregularis TaxID=588596 RepID=UPI00331B218E|nr:hypothetical protein OCT59_009170 [Rhizophagus irregularis]
MFFLVIAISSISLEKGMNFFSNIINKTGSWVNFRIIILKKVCHKSQYIIRNKLKGTMCERICEDRAATETQGLKMELRDCLNFLVVHTNQQTPDS